MSRSMEQRPVWPVHHKVIHERKKQSKQNITIPTKLMYKFLQKDWEGKMKTRELIAYAHVSAAPDNRQKNKYVLRATVALQFTGRAATQRDSLDSTL